MHEFVWKDCVKVQVREITRGEQMVLFRELTSDDLQSMPPLEQDEYLAARVAVMATRKILFCNAGKWEDIGDGGLFTLPDGDTLPLAYPTEAADFDGLPVSLAKTWIETALTASGGSIFAVLSFPSASLRNMSAGNGSTSENVTSSVSETQL